MTKLLKIFIDITKYHNLSVIDANEPICVYLDTYSSLS